MGSKSRPSGEKNVSRSRAPSQVISRPRHSTATPSDHSPATRASVRGVHGISAAIAAAVRYSSSWSAVSQASAGEPAQIMDRKGQVTSPAKSAIDRRAALVEGSGLRHAKHRAQKKRTLPSAAGYHDLGK